MKKDTNINIDVKKLQIVAQQAKEALELVEGEIIEEPTAKLIGVTLFKATEEETLDDFAKKLDNVKTKILKVEDLNDQYFVEIQYIDAEHDYESLNPEEVHPLDQFELSETINEALKELGVPVSNKIVSDEKSFESDINQEAKEMFRNLALSKLKKKKESAEVSDEEIQQSQG